MGTCPEFQGRFSPVFGFDAMRGLEEEEINRFITLIYITLFFSYKFLECRSMSNSLALNSQITMLTLHYTETFSNFSGIR